MPFLEDFFANNIWMAILIWGLVYIGDYYLTIFGARLYNEYGKEHFTYDGSYELTPIFQRDIDSLNPISTRFLSFLVLSSGLILVLWYLAVSTLGMTGLFSFAMGALLLRSGAVYIRHARSLALFSQLRHKGAIAGRVDYTRWVTYRLSAQELFSFAGLYLAIFALSLGWFFLGGALACAVLGLQHWRIHRKLRKGTTSG